ncbi:MAG: hypothetical protein LBL63_01670 [Clostridiales Family XIII bacterium]|nr:hypothetical protein [Clostridiales Family XIII bacterium]
MKTDRPAPESPAIQQAEEELRGLEALNAERKAKKKEYKKLEGSDAERRAKRKEYRALKDPAEDIAKKKEEIRALRDSVAADQGLADARLRRGDGQADDNVSTEPALLIHALYIALRDVTDPGFDHMDESKREELFKKKKSLIGDLKAKASTGDFVFNLRAMTRDKKGTLNESEGTAAQWDAFLKRLNAVAEAKNAVAFSVEAKALNDYIEDNKIRETADAALRSDIAPTTGEAIDKQIDGLIGSGLLIGKDRDGEKAALKEVYRKALEERMKGKHGQGDALLAADLVKNAREERKDAGIDDDETGARPALTIDAICLELTIITATPFKNMKPEEKNALKEQRDVFKGLSAKLHSFGDMNFFAMTVDRDKSKRTRDVQKLSDDFNAMLKYVTDAKSDEDFIARAAEMRDFVQWYDLPSRADAVMKAEAPVSEKLRRVDLDGVLGESTDSKPEQRQSEKQRLRKAVETPYALYGANRQKSATAETDVTGVELVFRAREERETKYGIKTDKVGGATFALTVLAIHNLARDTSGDAISGGLDDYKASFRALRDNLDTFFNLEAMTDDNKDKLEDSHVQRLREDYKGLIDAIGSCNTIGALRAKTLELYNFSMANSLQLRAEAAIELKPAEQEFSEKLDHAVGKQGQKDTRLSGIRTELNQLYADRIGVQAVSFEDASSLLSAEMKDKLDKITKIVVIGEFRSILPPKPFDEFMKDLQDSESDVFKRVTERIGAALADAEFEKKDKLGGAVKGSRYRPLEKKGAKGVSSERSAALARHLVNKFTGEVKDSKKTAKEWLGGQADMQQAESSRQQRQVEKAFGAEAAEAYKSTVVIGSIVDGLAERVGKDKTLHISNYAGGSLGVSAEVSEVSGSVDLALTVENDLSISHGSDGRWSIYIGGKLQADFGARISTDIGVASLGAGINVNLSGTNAMKLDFADESKCKEFLNSFFMGYDRSAPRGEDPGATPAQRSMLGLSERITPIRVIAGGVSLDASVSLSDKAGEILGETIERIPGVEEVKEAVTGVAENMKGRVEGFLNPVAESVAAFTEKKGGAAYKYLSSGTKEALSGFIKNARLPASVDRNGLQSELEEIFSNLDETIDGLIQEKIKERIEKFPGVAYDGIQEKITEKVKEALEDKVRTILVLLGAEAVKEDDQDDEKKGDEKKDDEKKGDEKKDDEKKDDEKKDDEKGVAGTIKEGASGVAGAIKEEAGDAAGKI